MQKTNWLNTWFWVTLTLAISSAIIGAFQPNLQFAIGITCIVGLVLSIVSLFSVRFPSGGPHLLSQTLRASARHSAYLALFSSFLTCGAGSSIGFAANFLYPQLPWLLALIVAIGGAFILYWAHMAGYERERVREKLVEADKAEADENARLSG